MRSEPTSRAGTKSAPPSVSTATAAAWDPVIEALAEQEPYWEPGTAHGYHAITFGWLVGEVVRRITGDSIGAFFAREVAKPLSLDFWIGLPEEEEGRVATMVQPQR